MEMVWSTHVAMHFLYSLTLDGFGYYKFRYILSSLAWEGFCQNKLIYIFVLAGMEGFGRFILCPRWYGKVLVNTG
jgi:hypothetical protein